MATQEKTIEEQINELEKQLGPKPTPGKEIDNMVEELTKSLTASKKESKDEKEKEQKRNTFLGEEKRLLAKIEAKETIINYLTNQLNSTKQELETLEERLECVRYCLNE